MAALATVAVGVALPLSLLAPVLGFVAPPPVFFGALVVLVVTYLVLIELAKHLIFGAGVPHPHKPAGRVRGHRRRIQRPRCPVQRDDSTDDPGSPSMTGPDRGSSRWTTPPSACVWYVSPASRNVASIGRLSIRTSAVNWSTPR